MYSDLLYILLDDKQVAGDSPVDNRPDTDEGEEGFSSILLLLGRQRSVKDSYPIASGGSAIDLSRSAQVKATMVSKRPVGVSHSVWIRIMNPTDVHALMV